MKPQIETLKEKKLLGQCLTMSMTNNKTGELWRAFKPRIPEITNNVGEDLYSLQVYSPGFFQDFNPQQSFEKWAAVEVKDFEEIPEGMETFVLPEGLYAVFHYKGLPSAASGFFQNIFTQWLPNSSYKLDDRPHFEVLGEQYDNNSPDSEEDVWVPIKHKS